MKSFGIWYSEDTRSKTDARNGLQSESETDVNGGIEIKSGENQYIAPRKGTDLHINLWNIGKEPFLDIGLRIRDFRKIEQLFILIPFRIEEDHMEDLSEKMGKVGIANLIFNDKCKIQAEEEYMSITYHKETEKPVLLYKLKNALLTEIRENDRSVLRFDFKNIKNDEQYNDFKDLYIRFRIQSEMIGKCLFSSIKNKNWFLESAFNSTQIIDVKVNKKRNLGESILSTIRSEDQRLLGFRRVDFFIMEPANHELDILGEDFSECRQLERGWKEYLPVECDFNSVLAYHWEGQGQDHELKEYAKMVKVTKATTSFKIIFIYIIVVIILGIVTNTIFQILWDVWLQKLIDEFFSLCQNMIRVLG